MNENQVTETVSIENAQLAFRNFAGIEGRFNQAGNRSFCILLEDDIADDMVKHGWNVKYLEPRNEDDKPKPYIQVSAKWNPKVPHLDPKVTMITSHGKRKLDESSVGNLDWAEITEADVVLRPYNWHIGEPGSPAYKSGVKAMLKALYVTVKEDEFESKYYDVPDSAANTMTFERVQKMQD